MVRTVLVICISWLTGIGCSSFSTRESYLNRGNQYFEQGKWDDAALQYRKALQKDQNYGEAYYRLGITDVKRGQPGEAVAALRKAVELSSAVQDRARVELADLAISLYVVDRSRPTALFQTAERIASDLLQKDTKSFNGLRLRAALAMASSDAQAAIDFYQKADTVKPDDPDVVFGLVQAFLLAKQDDAAEARALAMIGSKPQSAQMYDLLYGMYRRRGTLQEAASILRKKIEAYPGQSFYISQLAEFYWSSGKRPEAESTIAAVLAAPDGYREAGDLFVRLRLPDRASETYRQGLAAKPKDAAALQKRLVSVLLEQGKANDAAAVLDEILHATPEDLDALASRASLHMTSGKPEDRSIAIALFRKLIESDPRNASYHYQLSKALRDSDQADDGRKELQQVLRLNPQHLAALSDLAAISIAAVDAGAALDYAQKALAVEPRDPRIRLVRTAAWALQGEYKQVRQELGKLTQEFPGLAEPQIQAGLLELAERRYDDAARIFQRQYKPGNADLRPLKGLAEVAFGRNQPGQAFALVEQEYRRSLPEGQRPSRSLLELFAITADRAGQRGAALEAFDRLVNTYSARSADLVRLAQLAHLQGDTARAIDDLHRARQVAPNDPVVPAVLGAVLSETGRWEESVRCYRESLALNPNNPGVMNNLSYALADRGTSLDEAMKLAQSAVEKAPEQPQFVDTLGYVYLKQNKLDSAIQTFRTVVNRTGTVRSRIRLAQALQSKGDKQGAREQLELALKSHPPGEDQAAVQKMIQAIR